MDLDIWTDANCIGSLYDDAAGTWRLSIIRGGRSIELRPKRRVLATGFWDAPYAPDTAGRNRFAGRQLHVADTRDIERCDGLRSIVIGTGTSAHDIAAQLWETGANVTMIQRSPTIVTRIDSLSPAIEIYDTDASAPKPPSGFYIDVGASELIINGQIAVRTQRCRKIRQQRSRRRPSAPPSMRRSWPCVYSCRPIVTRERGQYITRWRLACSPTI
jgi:putative flavoprotein involved in K+ transport